MLAACVVGEKYNYFFAFRESISCYNLSIKIYVLIYDSVLVLNILIVIGKKIDNMLYWLFPYKKLRFF